MYILQTDISTNYNPIAMHIFGTSFLSRQYLWKKTCTQFKIVSTVKHNHHWLDLGVEKNGNMITLVNTVEK